MPGEYGLGVRRWGFWFLILTLCSGSMLLCRRWMGFMDDGVYGFEYGIKLRKTIF